MRSRRFVLGVALAMLAGCAVSHDDSDTATGNDALSSDAGPSDAGHAFSVKFIGDSHSDYEGNARGAFGFLGQHLKELMSAGGIPFALYGASGSVPTWWFDDTSTQAARWGYTQTASSPPRRTCSSGGKSGACVPKLAVILNDTPSLFVIEQGTNLLGRGAASITQDIQTMLRQIAGKTGACLWVGAPNARTSVHSQQSQDQLWALIKQNASASCFTYDSRFLPRIDASGKLLTDAHGDPIVDVPLPYSPDANNDGEHLGMTAAGKWAEGVMQMITFIRNRPR